MLLGYRDEKNLVSFLIRELFAKDDNDQQRVLVR